MNPLPDIIDGAGLTSVWTYLALFLAASLLMVWRLDALLKHGLEGTALGTLVMPYCSGLGNLLFVWIIAQRKGPGSEVLTNCLVNNVTNLTLVLGLPALVWGLEMRGGSAAKKSGAKKSSSVAGAGGGASQGRRSSRPEAGEYFRHERRPGEDFGFRVGEIAQSLSRPSATLRPRRGGRPEG